MENPEDMKKDESELKALLKISKRKTVQNLLNLELQKLNEKLTEVGKNPRVCNLEEVSKNITRPIPKKNRIKINTYAWDQTPKYVKFFVTLPGVQSLSQNSIDCQFHIDSLELTVRNLDKKDYTFTINKLLYLVVPDESFWKVKSDAIIIFVVKSEAIKWSHVTKLEKEFSDSKKRKYATERSEKSDGSNLLSLMKNMYEKGDDNLKRTIAQAWTEVHSGKEFGGF